MTAILSAAGSSPLGSTVYNIVNFGADPTGTKDSTAAITAAKAAAGAGTRNQILIPPGTYLTGPLALGGYWWRGYGPTVSILKANAGSANWITNNTAATTEADTLVEGIGFDGTSLTGTATVFTWASTNKTVTGPTVSMKDCWVYKGPAVGIDTSNAGGNLNACHFYNVATHDNGTRGWVLGSDQVLTGCVAANSGTEGFYTNGTSNWTMEGCFSYGNGTVTPGSGYGYHLQGTSTGAAMTGCHAQDNEAAGLLFDSTSGGYTATGFIADSNSRRSAGANAAVAFFAASGCKAQYLAVDRASVQLNALSADSTSTGNVIECDAFYSTQTTVTNWILSGTAPGNTLILGNSQGQQAPAFAATITPDVPTGGTVIPAALTGAVTIAAPTNPWTGAKLAFELTQDSTGGRAVSWNAVYVFQAAWTNTGNTLNKRSKASFTYDGTNWVCDSPAANVWF